MKNTKTRRLSFAFLISILSLGFIGLAGASSTVTATSTVSAPVCAIGLNAGGFNFGTLYGGEVLAPTNPNWGVTVTNDSTFVPGVGGNPPLGVSTSVTVSGTNWLGSGSNHFGVDNTSVEVNVSSDYTTAGNPYLYTSPFSLAAPPGTASGTVVTFKPGGTAGILFGLTVPVGVPSDTYTQVITFGTAC